MFALCYKTLAIRNLVMTHTSHQSFSAMSQGGWRVHHPNSRDSLGALCVCPEIANSATNIPPVCKWG